MSNTNKNLYNTLASGNMVSKTVRSLEEKKYHVDLVKNGDEALNRIKELIPLGASVMNGSSLTLEQIGFSDYLKSGKYGFINLHKEITDERDPVVRSKLRKKSVLSDFYLGSVHALTETGEFLVASNTGSQLPHIVYTSPNLVFVVGTQKIVHTLKDGFERLNSYVVPLEDQRMQKMYGMPTRLNKIVIFKGENENIKRKINFILVKEKLGF